MIRREFRGRVTAVSWSSGQESLRLVTKERTRQKSSNRRAEECSAYFDAEEAEAATHQRVDAEDRLGTVLDRGPLQALCLSRHGVQPTSSSESSGAQRKRKDPEHSDLLSRIGSLNPRPRAASEGVDSTLHIGLGNHICWHSTLSRRARRSRPCCRVWERARRGRP